MKRQIILGMGAGQCGGNLLASVLDGQPNAKFTHEEPPFLPWYAKPGAPGVRQRLERILERRSERFIGDVASFYLPYVEQAVEFDPDIRIICLQRPCEEVVAGFSRSVDKASTVPTNYWCKELPPGWFDDPMWTRIFPKYDTPDRSEALRLYWSEYYERAEALVRRFPDNIRLWDTTVLTTQDGVREVLTFAGIPQGDQVPVTGQAPKPETFAGPISQPVPRYPHPMDPRRCVILVPFSGFIHQECDSALKELERRGYQVRRVGGYAAIDQGRNQMATDALIDGFEETFWIDSDIGFHPDSGHTNGTGLISSRTLTPPVPPDLDPGRGCPTQFIASEVTSAYGVPRSPPQKNPPPVQFPY